MPLRFRGTFIEASPSDGSSDDSDQSKAVSDPGSTCSKEGHSDGVSRYFHREKSYVVSLSENVRQWQKWQKARRSSESGEYSQCPTAEGWSESADQSQALEESTDLSSGDASPSMSHPLSSQKGLPLFVIPKVGANHFLPQQEMTISKSGAQKQKQKKMVLCNIHAKAAEVKDLFSWQRLSSALASINEIPEQVEMVLQQQASNVMDQMQDEVAVAQDIIQSDGEQETTATEKAKQSMAVIPDLVMNSFNRNISKAMNSVRFTVDDVVSGLEADPTIENNRLLERQIQDIPVQVRQIAANAVEKAVEDSQKEVEEQMSQARCSFEGPDDGALLDAQHRVVQRAEQIFASIPRAFPVSANVALQANVEQVLDTVQKNADGRLMQADSHGFPDGLPNRVVADALLRAKTGDDLGASTEALNTRGLGFSNCNPGSVGHPEFCSRPCLFFSQGQCTNGMSCCFCHLPHPRRAAHLDKRNRSMLQKLDLSNRFVLIGPVIRKKLTCLESAAQSLIEELDCLSCQISDSSASWTMSRSRQARDTRSLSIALQSMTARSLLALLSHTPVAKDSEEHQAIASFLAKVSKYLRPLPEENDDEADPDYTTTRVSDSEDATCDASSYQ